MNIKFTKLGHIEKTVEDENEDIVWRIVKTEESIIPFFSSMLTFEDDFKLKDLFAIMKRHPELQHINPFINEYMELYESRKPEMVVQTHSEFDHIAVCPCIDVRFSDFDVELNDKVRSRNDDDESDVSYDENGNKKLKLYNAKSIFNKTERAQTKVTADAEIHAHLIKYVSEDEAQKEQVVSRDRDGYPYIVHGMSFVDVMEIADLPIKENGGIVTIDKDLAKNEKLDVEIYDSSEMDVDVGGMALMNVFNIIDSIVTEICFHGGPEESQEFLDEIVKLKDEVENSEHEYVDLDREDEDNTESDDKPTEE